MPNPATRKKRRRYVWRYTTIAAIIDMLRREKLPLLNPERWDDRNDRHFMKLYKAHTKAEGLYGMCAALVPETYHHWRVFTGNSDGACLVLKRKPLEDYLRTRRDVRFQEIEYVKLEEARELEVEPDDLPFLKRWGFRAEEEYRIVAETDEEQREVFFLDLQLDWIDRIYINPWLPPAIAESVIDTINELEGCEDIDVRPSHLIDSSTWKKTGDRIAGVTDEAAMIRPRRRVTSKRTTRKVA